MKKLVILLSICLAPSTSLSDAEGSSGLSGMMNAWGVGENLGLMAMFMDSGAAKIAAGSASVPPNKALIAMGIKDLMTADKHKDSAGSNRRTGIDSTYKQGQYNYGNESYSWDAAEKDFDRILADAEIKSGDNTYTPKELLGTDLSKKIPEGYSVDENGNVTTPDGKSYSADQLSSGANMAKAGLIKSDPTVINMMDDELNKKKRKFKISGLRRPSMGGYSNKSRRKVKNQFDFKMPNYGSQGRSPASGPKTTGLSVNYNGQPVGAATGSLLGGIGQAYKRERERGQYVQPASK